MFLSLNMNLYMNRLSNIAFRIFTILSLSLQVVSAVAQENRMGISGYAQLNSISSHGDYAPYWLTAKNQGLSSVEKSNGYARVGVLLDGKFGEKSNWKYSVVADAVTAYNQTDVVALQQLNADFSWKWLRLSVGSKERFAEMKNFCVLNDSSSFVNNSLNKLFPNLYYNKYQELSSGGLVYSGNSRPIPQLRVEIPEYVEFPWTNGWMQIKAHLAYGYFADGGFQEDFTASNEKARYGKNIFYHSKSLFIKVGKKEKFPLTFEGGLEMHTQFGGNVYTRSDGKVVSMPAGVKDFFKAFIPMGGDENTPEYEQTNISGNFIGSWHAAFTYHTKPVDVRLYAEHMFEDFSQLFFMEYQSDASGDRNLIYYPWRDILVGISLTNKSSFMPFVSNVLYEYVSTYDQSGAGYNDPGPFFKEQMDGADNYFNHSIYPGWHYQGMGIGTPLAVSPVYNTNGSLRFASNRFVAHNVGVNGTLGRVLPLAYRLQYTYSENWGTYLNPFREKKYTTSLLCDIIYAPTASKWAGTISLGYDKSNFIGENLGVMFTITRLAVFK